MARELLPVRSNLKTSEFVFAELFANASEAGAVVVVAKPVPAFTAVPAKEVTWGFEASDVQAEEPFVPSRYKLPEPKFAT